MCCQCEHSLFVSDTGWFVCLCVSVFTVLSSLFCMSYRCAEPQPHGQLDMASNTDGKCDTKAHRHHIYKFMSFNTPEVCFIKEPFCIVERISTESGNFLSTLSAIPWRYSSTALQKIKTPLLNLLQASRFGLFTFPSFSSSCTSEFCWPTTIYFFSFGRLKCLRYLKSAVKRTCML